MTSLDAKSLDQMSKLDGELTTLRREVADLRARKEELVEELPMLIEKMLAAYHAKWPLLEILEDYD